MNKSLPKANQITSKTWYVIEEGKDAGKVKVPTLAFINFLSESEQSNALIGTPINNEKLLKDVQLCEVLQISTAHFYKMKKAHKDFPVYDIYGAKRYKLSEVELFLKSLKQ